MPVTSFIAKDTPVDVSEETFNVEFGGGDTSLTITPTNIAAIHSVYYIPTNAAAAASQAAGTTIFNTFNTGEATVVMGSAVSSNYVVVVRGQVA